MMKMIQNLTGGVSDEQDGSYILQRALSPKIGNFGFKQGRQLFNAARSGSMGEVESIMEAVRAGGAGDLSGGLDSDAVKLMTSAARSNAALQDKLLTAGQRIEPAVTMLNTKAAELSGKLAKLGDVMVSLEPVLSAGSAAIGTSIDAVVGAMTTLTNALMGGQGSSE